MIKQTKKQTLKQFKEFYLNDFKKSPGFMPVACSIKKKAKSFFNFWGAINSNTS